MERIGGGERGFNPYWEWYFYQASVLDWINPKWEFKYTHRNAHKYD